jgi:hypothetical protein
MELIAVKGFKYKGKPIKPGERFTAEGRWKTLLQRAGLAKEAPVKVDGRTKEAKALRATSSSATISNEPDVYNRRDITRDDLDTH